MAEAEKGSSGTKSKGSQGKFPGAEGERFPEVTKAANEYKGLRDERMELEQKERAARDRLTTRMQKRTITAYVFEDEEFEAYIPETPEPQAKVRTIKTEE